MFCTGVAELHASSWDVCLENGSVSMIGGSSFGPIKSHSLDTPTSPVKWPVVSTGLNRQDCVPEKQPKRSLL